MSKSKAEKKQSILDEIMADPEQLQENPELLKIAMVEFAASIDTRLKEIKNAGIDQSLIKRFSSPVGRRE